MQHQGKRPEQRRDLDRRGRVSTRRAQKTRTRAPPTVPASDAGQHAEPCPRMHVAAVQHPAVILQPARGEKRAVRLRGRPIRPELRIENERQPVVGPELRDIAEGWCRTIALLERERQSAALSPVARGPGPPALLRLRKEQSVAEILERLILRAQIAPPDRAAPRPTARRTPSTAGATALAAGCGRSADVRRLQQQQRPCRAATCPTRSRSRSGRSSSSCRTSTSEQDQARDQACLPGADDGRTPGLACRRGMRRARGSAEKQRPRFWFPQQERSKRRHRPN